MKRYNRILREGTCATTVKNTSLSRRERKKIETKEKIFKAALSLFLEKGFENTTVEEITEKADVGKGTFFNYFPRKESILIYLGERRMEAIQEAFRETISEDLTIEAILKRIFEILAQENLKEKPLVKWIVMQSFKARKSVKEEVKEQQHYFRSLLEHLIDKGQRRGEIRREFKALKLAEILEGIYFSSVFKWLESEKEDSLAGDLLEKIEIIFEGIRPR
ncbi:MAG TPA: TetR/AcrR family transcriptional regulator [Candidatus Limnocylindrales bacterium]|nr:TetR/AcrR family transcriptional regulator [Candidatus Limnocylindrales bacterium]